MKTAKLISFLKSQKTVFGVVLLLATKLYFYCNLTFLFTRTEAVDALLAVLPTIILVWLCIPLLWSDFMTAYTWQMWMAFAAGVYFGATHLYWLIRVVDDWSITVGFTMAGVMFFVLMLIGITTASAYLYVLWIKRNVRKSMTVLINKDVWHGR